MTTFSNLDLARDGKRIKKRQTYREPREKASVGWTEPLDGGTSVPWKLSIYYIELNSEAGYCIKLNCLLGLLYSDKQGGRAYGV